MLLNLSCYCLDSFNDYFKFQPTHRISENDIENLLSSELNPISEPYQSYFFNQALFGLLHI